MLGTRRRPVNLAALMASFQRRLLSVGVGGEFTAQRSTLVGARWLTGDKVSYGQKVAAVTGQAQKWRNIGAVVLNENSGRGEESSNICKQDHWMSFRVLAPFLTTQPSAFPASIMQTLAFRRLFKGARWRTIPPVAREETRLPRNTSAWCISGSACSSSWGSFHRGFTGKPRAEDNGALLTVIAGFLLQRGHGAIFMSQEKLLQPSHFVSQQGDFALWGQEREQNTGGARQTVMSDITHLRWL